MLRPNDTPRVSTILEEMFQFFDASARCRRYRTIEKHIRLRLALLVFSDSGYARLDTIMNPMPTVVPTAKLLKLLELTSQTTDLESPKLLPVQDRISQPEASDQLRYIRTFKSVMANDIDKFLGVPTAMLNMWERGLLRHGRSSNGDLVWIKVENSGKKWHLTESPGDAKCVERPGIGKDLELEFEIDSDNILLLREDDLPIGREVLEVLQITHKELDALFKTAARLLAETNLDDRMRAYAAQESSGKWRVELLPA
jgi:hypothetical protein